VFLSRVGAGWPGPVRCGCRPGGRSGGDGLVGLGGQLRISGLTTWMAIDRGWAVSASGIVTHRTPLHGDFLQCCGADSELGAGRTTAKSIELDVPQGRRELAGCWTRKDGRHVAVAPSPPTPRAGVENSRLGARGLVCSGLAQQVRRGRQVSEVPGHAAGSASDGAGAGDDGG